MDGDALRSIVAGPRTRVGRALGGLADRGRSFRSNRTARRTLRLLRRAGVARIPRSTRRRVRRYARDVLGAVRHRHWLFVYAAHHGSFRTGWIPDDLFAERILPVVNTGYRNLSAARSLTRRVLGADEVPDIAAYLHGAWYGRDLEPLTRDQVMVHCFGAEPTAEVVIKAESSNQGRGVIVVDAAGFAALAPALLGDLVVQRRVRQHPALEAMVPGCTATVRVTTVLVAGSVRTVATYLRLGRAGDRAVRSATQVRVPVVDSVGTLGAVATTADWSRHTVHPDTGFRFAGAAVPRFADVVATCERLHARAPQFTVVGWDVVPEDDGRVAVLEWNTDHPDIKFTEATFGPGFVDLGFEAL